MKGGRIKRRAPTLTDRLVRTAERQKPEQISILSPRPVSDGSHVKKKSYHGPKIVHHSTKNHYLGGNFVPTTKNGYYDAKNGYHDAKNGYYDVNKTHNGTKTYVSGLSTTALSTTALSTTALRSSMVGGATTAPTNNSNQCHTAPSSHRVVGPESDSILCSTSVSVSKAQQRIINEIEKGENE